jgi:hypothetical protein
MRCFFCDLYCRDGGIGRHAGLKKLSAWLETADVEPLKFGETLSVMIGNPEPSLMVKTIVEGVET